MRTTSPRRVLFVLTATIVIGFGRAGAEEAPQDLDAARQGERYVIRPGAESLVADMLGRGESLAGGCALSDGRIERTAVLATYTCGDGQTVLALRHPTDGAAAVARTKRFALAVERGVPPSGLVAAVAERMRAREAAFEWTEVGHHDATAMPWLAALGAGVAVAVLAVWALRRRAARRARTP